MAIGVDQIYLSMQSPDSGEYLTANVYTVDGVTNADNSPRYLSIGQLVMALCLQRASALEAEIVSKMDTLESVTEMLECMTEIETAILDGDVNMNTKKIRYRGTEYTYFAFLDEVVEMENAPTGVVNASSTDELAAIEAEMDSKNTFSQQTMIELQSQTAKRDQSYDMVSNILKSLNTTIIGNVNNF